MSDNNTQQQAINLEELSEVELLRLQVEQMKIFQNVILQSQQIQANLTAIEAQLTKIKSAP